MVSKSTPPAKIVILIELGSHREPTQIADALVYERRSSITPRLELVAKKRVHSHLDLEVRSQAYPNVRYSQSSCS